MRTKGNDELVHGFITLESPGISGGAVGCVSSGCGVSGGFSERV